MTIRSDARSRLASARVHSKALKLTSACVAVLAAASAAHADPQDQTTDTTKSGSNAGTGSEIVVTGIRKSLQASVAVKRQTVEVVEAISAEDIGKLPDESIADSLTRLPGIAGQRVGGRYQDIAIRGLSPDFTSTLLNGFQQASTGDNRAAEFDQYPSELINGAEVFKTPSPTLVGAGLAGTVDLHTLDPLDLSKRTFAINVRGSTNSLGSLIPGFSSTGDRISGAYVDQFFDGKVGVSVGLAHLDAPEMERWYQNWYWGVNPGMPPADANAQAIQGNDIYAFARRVTRDAAMATLEFKPTPAFHSINNVFFSKFRQTEEMRGLNIIQGGYSDGNQTVTNPTFQTIGGQLFNTGGTINEIQPLFQSFYNTRNDNELSLISRNTWDVIGGWHLGGDLSYSYAQRKESQVQEFAQYGATGTPDSVTFANTATTNGFPQWTPSGNLNYADASKIYLNCPSPWGGCWGHDGLVHAPTTRDTIAEGKLYGRHDIGGWGGNFFEDVTFGVDYSDRTKKKTELDYNLDIPGALVDSGNNLTGSGATATLLLPQSVVTSPVDLGWAGFGKIFGYDPQKLLRYYTYLPIANEQQFSNNWNVEEKLATFFAKLDIKSELLSVPVTGNVGLQYVYATQDSNGYVTQPAASGMAIAEPFSHSKSYGDVLPSLNLRFALPANQFVHLSVAREMSRPRLDQLVVNTSAGVSLPTDHTQNPPLPCAPTPANATTCYGSWSGNGGNPDLKPWMATAFDLTYEKYFGSDKASYIAVQYYYKDLSTYIYQQSLNFDFAGYPNLNAYPVDPNAGTIGINTRPANGQGGKIEGLEIGGTLSGKLISPWAGEWVEGFGVTGSFAKAWTTILQNGPKFINGQLNPQFDATVPLEGLSGTVASWTVFYEKYGFSARVSGRYRAPYYADVGGLFASINKVEIAADESMDAQVSYDVPWGPMKGLTLLVQGYNITNSPYRQYASTTPSSAPTNLKYYQDYGRTILFGFNYKF